jgi:hypothetical protein
MTPNLDTISDALKSPKHPFHQAEGRFKKPDKHRYERRKVKEILTKSDWQSQEDDIT